MPQWLRAPYGLAFALLSLFLFLPLLPAASTPMPPDHPIFWAVENDDAAEIRRLAAADPTCVTTANPRLGLPIVGAVTGDHRVSVKVLLELGADVNTKVKPPSKRQIITEAKSIEVLEILLKAGTDPYGGAGAAMDNNCDPIFGLLHDKRCTVEILQIFEEHGRDLVAGFRYKNHKSLLAYACERADPEVVRYLLKAGANPLEKMPIGWTPMHFASAENLPILYALGLDPDAACDEGYTPLWFAVYDEQRLDDGRIRWLVDHGADVNHADSIISEHFGGCTPLHLAFWVNGSPITEDQLPYTTAMYLLNRGANLNIRDHNGITPLGSAMYRRQFDTVMPTLYSRALRIPAWQPALLCLLCSLLFASWLHRRPLVLKPWRPRSTLLQQLLSLPEPGRGKLEPDHPVISPEHERLRIQLAMRRRWTLMLGFSALSLPVVYAMDPLLSAAGFLTLDPRFVPFTLVAVSACISFFVSLDLLSSRAWKRAFCLWYGILFAPLDAALCIWLACFYHDWLPTYWALPVFFGLHALRALAQMVLYINMRPIHRLMKTREVDFLQSLKTADTVDFEHPPGWDQPGGVTAVKPLGLTQRNTDLPEPPDSPKQA